MFVLQHTWDCAYFVHGGLIDAQRIPNQCASYEIEQLTQIWEKDREWEKER